MCKDIDVCFEHKQYPEDIIDYFICMIKTNHPAFCTDEMYDYEYDRDNELMLKVIREIIDKDIKRAKSRLFWTFLFDRATTKELVDEIFNKMNDRLDTGHLQESLDCYFDDAEEGDSYYEINKYKKKLIDKYLNDNE